MLDYLHEALKKGTTIIPVHWPSAKKKVKNRIFMCASINSNYPAEIVLSVFCRQPFTLVWGWSHWVNALRWFSLWWLYLRLCQKHKMHHFLCTRGLRTSKTFLRVLASYVHNAQLYLNFYYWTCFSEKIQTGEDGSKKILYSQISTSLFFPHRCMHFM